jgi:hypothetical protein
VPDGQVDIPLAGAATPHETVNKPERASCRQPTVKFRGCAAAFTIGSRLTDTLNDWWASVAARTSLRAAVSNALNGDAKRTGSDKGGISTKANDLVPKSHVRVCDIDLTLTLDRNPDVANGPAGRDISCVLGKSYLVGAGSKRYARRQ